LEKFSKKVINWYLQNKRDLPWRNTRDAYKIWLSEIILQQTRVEQGLPYYEKFVAAFPTIKDLAKAPQDKVMKLWQGLGYYSRARNLQFAAQWVMSEHKGKFPKEYNEIIKMKGVGEYTAAAIASFAYDLPHPVLDGNVYRILSRIFGIHDAIDSSAGKKKFMEKLHELLPVQEAANFNQSIMEFGAIQCVPKNPKCDECIFKNECYAFANEKIELLPIKEKKLIKKDRHFYYLISSDGENTIIKKRADKDIWHSLYEFPLFEKPIETKEKIIYQSEIQKHLLTHQNIYFQFTVVKVKSLKPKKDEVLVPLTQLEEFAFPKIMHDFIAKKLNLYLPIK
jgi:A/G-specific adenine glycosylase